MKNRQIIGIFPLLAAAFIRGRAFVAQRVGMARIGPLTFQVPPEPAGGADRLPNPDKSA